MLGFKDKNNQWCSWEQSLEDWIERALTSRGEGQSHFRRLFVSQLTSRWSIDLRQERNAVDSFEE